MATDYRPEVKVSFGALSGVTTTLVIGLGAYLGKPINPVLVGFLVTVAYAIAAYMIPDKHRRKLEKLEQLLDHLDLVNYGAQAIRPPVPYIAEPDNRTEPPPVAQPELAAVEAIARQSARRILR